MVSMSVPHPLYIIELTSSIIYAVVLTEVHMGLTTLMLAGVITATQMLYITRDINEKLFLTVLGYKAWFDLVCGIGMTVYFALSGTISGVILAAIAGAMLSFCLYASKVIFGYRKFSFKKRQWVDYPPAINIPGLNNRAA